MKVRITVKTTMEYVEEIEVPDEAIKAKALKNDKACQEAGWQVIDNMWADLEKDKVGITIKGLKFEEVL